MFNGGILRIKVGLAAVDLKWLPVVSEEQSTQTIFCLWVRNNITTTLWQESQQIYQWLEIPYL